MPTTIQDIATALGATALGAVDFVVTGLSEPATAGPDDLALAMSPQYGDALAQGQAQAAVVWDGADWQGLGLQAAIIAPRARLAMAGLTQMMDPPLPHAGISKHAIVEGARLGVSPHVGAFSVIGAGAELGDHVWIGTHVSIDPCVVIGAGAVIHDGVRIKRNTRIGDNVVLQPNVVIGGDGFSFVTASPSHVETGKRSLGKTPFAPMDDPVQHRIHALGGVVIGNMVEIGANSTVDAGTIRATAIGHGTKVDNLVQVGHNVVIGDHCLLCAQTAVAGSARIGDRSVLGGKSGIADNLRVGTDCVIGGAAIVLSDVADGSFMMGYPAQPMLKYRQRERALRQATIGHNTVSKPAKSP